MSEAPLAGGACFVHVGTRINSIAYLHAASTPGHGSSRRFDADHSERVHVAVLILDRDIFARQKHVRAKAVPGLVIVGRALVVIEHPTCMLGAARLVHDPANLLVRPVPEPAHTTMVAVLLPK